MDTPDGLRGKQKWFHPLGLDGTNEELLETGWTMKTFDEILKVLNYTKVSVIFHLFKQFVLLNLPCIGVFNY